MTARNLVMAEMAENPARALWNARLDGGVLPYDFAGAPKTEEEAYRIQAEMIAYSGLDVIGWKIGASSEQLFSVLGVTRPFLGPLFQEYTYAGNARVPVAAGQGLETEVTLQMKADLPFRDSPYERNDIAVAVGALFPSFEIVGRRFDGSGGKSGFRLIADGGANAGMVLGPACADWHGLDLTGHPVTLSINDGEPQAAATDVLLWDHLFDAAGWVACHPALKDRGLRAGDYVMTGTCTGLTPLSPGDSAVADFGVMGAVRADFVQVPGG